LASALAATVVGSMVVDIGVDRVQRLKWSASGICRYD